MKNPSLAGVRKKVLKQNLITASVRQGWDNKKVRSGKFPIRQSHQWIEFPLVRRFITMLLPFLLFFRENPKIPFAIEEMSQMASSLLFSIHLDA